MQIFFLFSVIKLGKTDRSLSFLQFFVKKNQEVRGLLGSSSLQCCKRAFVIFLPFALCVSCNSPIAYWYSSIKKTSIEKEIFYYKSFNAFWNLFYTFCFGLTSFLHKFMATFPLKCMFLLLLGITLPTDKKLVFSRREWDEMKNKAALFSPPKYKASSQS